MPLNPDEQNQLDAARHELNIEQTIIANHAHRQSQQEEQEKLFTSQRYHRYRAELFAWQHKRQEALSKHNEYEFKLAQSKVETYQSLLGLPPEPAPEFISSPDIEKLRQEASLSPYEEKERLKAELQAPKTAKQPSHPSLEQIIAAIPTFSREDRKTIARKAVEGL